MVGIVVIDSRSKTHKEWVKQCLDSIRSQTYRDIDVRVIDNTAKLLTIGRCRNQGAKMLEGCKWILYVDDDDWIERNYVQYLLDFAEYNDSPELAGVSTSCTFMYPDHWELRSEVPIGMWKREYLLEHPYDEGLTKYEDIDMVKKLVKGGKHRIMSASYLTGYYYRQHDCKNSGLKLTKNEQEVKALLEKAKGFAVKEGKKTTLKEEVSKISNQIMKGLENECRRKETVKERA